jgi:putative membrane protein
VLAFLLNLAFWEGLVFLIVWVVKQFRPSADPQAREDPAMRILEERFARGEIDADEFQRRREVLKGSAR